MKRLLTPFWFLSLLANVSLAQQNECPRIFQVGDTLKTDPAPSYQWYKNGGLIPNADKIWYRPTETGDYTVAVGASSTGYNFVADPADLRVEVFDAKLKPVAGATVTANGQTTTTDGAGKAFLPAVVSGRTTVKIVKNGFFDGFTVAYKPATGAAIVKIQLEKFPSALTFQDSASATVAAPSGLSIKFPKNAFKKESTGAPYNGEVKIYFNHRAPENDPMFSFAMPGGDFTAIDANGETVALTSYGFFNAELRGANGEKLNLKSGVTADVQFRIPEKMRAAAPASVPLWSFDETAGTWKYDSELTQNGIFYKGKVSHFSSWNCDYQGPACTVIASAVDCNGNPASGVSLCFVGGVCGVTDANGQIFFPNIPANQALTLTSNQDTINIAPIGVGETFTLAEPIQAGESMIAFADYWQDSVEVYVWGEQPPVQYSLDGQNWQSESLFIDVPFQDSVIVWIKDESDCPITHKAYFSRIKKSLLCVTANDTAEINQFQSTWADLPNYALPVLYQLWGEGANNPLIAYAANQYLCLAILDAAYGNVTTLPAEIGNLTSLIKLNLFYNQLTVIPAEIGNLNALKILDLGGNQLTGLPTEIGNLAALEWFYLLGNQFTTLPIGIGNLSSLKFLDLGSNKLTNLTPEIGNLAALTTLGLSSNQLTSLPPEIGNLPTIQNIYLPNNPLTALPPEIANLADTLQTLDLRFTPIPVGDRPYYQSLLPNTTIQWE